jgi:CRP/FNR family transcriptional regulator, anaerobic regulatory protein
MHSSTYRDDTRETVSRFSLAIRATAHPLHLASPCDTCRSREFSACAPLTAEEQKRLAATMRTISVEPHCSIFNEADPAEYVYNITAGTVKVYNLLGDGRRQITGFLFAGDFLGLTHNDAYAYSAEALVPTRLCRYPRRRLEALLVEIPHLEQRLLAMASHELAAAQDQMMPLGRKSARERVVSFILMLSNSATQHGRPSDPVFLPMSRSDIADYLGLTTETVSRTFTLLKKQELIELLDEKRVRLSRMSALREIAEGF